MDKNARIIAITRILPGLQNFLGEVLANESLSSEAEQQRLEILKALEELTRPPVLPPRPANLKSQSRSSVESVESTESTTENDFASVQRKLSNIFYLRRDFEEINEHLVNGSIIPEETNRTSLIKKTPGKKKEEHVETKVRNKKKDSEGIYEDLQQKEDSEEFEVLSEEETPKSGINRSLARGAHFRTSLGKSKWFTRKEKSIAHEVFVGDLLLPSIAGHLMEVRTNKRRWCVLKDHHLYIFKNQEEPAYFVIDLPGCDISTVPKADKSKVSYSFKITQNGVAAMVLGIEEEKDLSAWMNALITASLAKTPLSPPQKMTRTLPRGTSSPLELLEQEESSSHHEIRRHTFGSYPFKTKDINIDIDLSNYEQPTEIMGLEPLDIENYNPPLPPLPGEIDELLVKEEEGVSRSRVYEEVTEEFLKTISKDSKLDEGEENASVSTDLKGSQELLVVDNNEMKTGQSYSEVATSDSEYSSDEDRGQNERLFHDRWALHSGVLYQKKATSWNKQYCKIVDNTFKGFRNPDDQSPILEMNLSGYHVRAAEVEGKRKFIFQINIAEEECLYFNTDTKASLERWIEVISIAATSRPETSFNLSEDELDKSAEISQGKQEMSHAEPETPREGHQMSHDQPEMSHKDHEKPYKDDILHVKMSNEEPKMSHEEHEMSHGDHAMSHEQHEISHEEHKMSHEEHEKSHEEHKMSHDESETSRSDTPPLPVPERVESLRRSRILAENKENSIENPAKHLECVETDEKSETTKKESKIQEKTVNEDVWQRRSQKRNYHTAPRQRNTRKKLPRFSSNSLKHERIQGNSNSAQHALHMTKKSQYRQRLQKYLDSKGQFSGFILELTIQPNSTNLTRRWAVVHNGFLRMYENYGCAVPFLNISLVEAFLKDFTNVGKSRYCFMLEYGAGKSIMLLTNTHKELQRWMTVITLSIASHTDLFGSGLDLRRCENQALLNSAGTASYVRRTSEPTATIATLAKPEVSSSEDGDNGSIVEENMNKRETTYDSYDSKQSIYDTCSGQEVTSQELVNGDCCDCRCGEDDGKVSVSCTPLIIRKALHHKSYDMTNSGDSDDPVGEKCPETYTSRVSPGSKYSGFLHVTRGDGGKDTRAKQFCEVKGSLFSIYDNEKCENVKEVFNLLYDNYQELPNKENESPNMENASPNKEYRLPNKENGSPNMDTSKPGQNVQKMFSFSIKNDIDGVIRFDCDEKKEYKIWKKVLRHTALQETGSNESLSTNVPKKVNSDSSNRKRSSFRASLIEEESKHHDVLRRINQDIANGVLQCDCSEYKCHVYEVRNSGENRTIIRRWCVVSNGVVRIFERETSREAVTELKQSSYCVKDIENPGDFPFSIQLDPVRKTTHNSEKMLVIQASNVNDFHELLKRLKIVCKQKLTLSKSESFLPTEKKKVPPLTHSKSDLSIRKEVKRIFSLSRKSSKSDIMADVLPLGHDTWPKVTRRERKSSGRALSDTSTEQPLRYSLVEDTSHDKRKSIYDPDEHYTGYLSEVRNSELCRSEVRKWCVLHEHQFSAYDDKATHTPSTVINLRTTQLVDMSHVYHNSFEFRVNNGLVKSYLYKATTDFQKWVLLLSEAISSGLDNDKHTDKKELRKASLKCNDEEDTSF